MSMKEIRSMKKKVAIHTQYTLGTGSHRARYFWPLASNYWRCTWLHIIIVKWRNTDGLAWSMRLFVRGLRARLTDEIASGSPNHVSKSLVDQTLRRFCAVLTPVNWYGIIITIIRINFSSYSHYTILKKNAWYCDSGAYSHTVILYCSTERIVVSRKLMSLRFTVKAVFGLKQK